MVNVCLHLAWLGKEGDAPPDELEDESDSISESSLDAYPSEARSLSLVLGGAIFSVVFSGRYFNWLGVNFS